MPTDWWRLRMRRVEITLGLLLLAVSFGPWWTRLDGAGSSAWTGPHLSWLAVLLCLAVVAGRSVTQRIIGDRWAAVAVVAALAITGWGWLAEHAPDVSMPGEGYDRQIRVVLQDQEAAAAMPVGGPFDVAWGYPVGLCLMGLLLAALVTTARPRRGR